MYRHVALATGSLCLLLACSPAPVRVAQSSHDPSSPTAPEGMSPIVVAPPSTAAEHAAHDHAVHATSDGGAAQVYVCPMHPEVTSDAPGLCPKCNMKLVPKK